MITNAGLERILTMLDSDITHIGIGAGAEPTETDTTLASEAERKQATSFIDSQTLIKEGYWDENEANGVEYTNAGVFGEGATDTLDTGALIAGGGINVAKNNTQSLTVSVEITVETI